MSTHPSVCTPGLADGQGFRRALRLQPMPQRSRTMTQQTERVHEHGDVIDVAKLKKSPRNARRLPHSEADIEALAASIAGKGVLQKPVVEPGADESGAPTGFYLVTIGEGSRLALCRFSPSGRRSRGRACALRGGPDQRPA